MTGWQRKCCVHLPCKAPLCSQWKSAFNIIKHPHGTHAECVSRASVGWSRGRDGYLHMFHARGAFYSTRKVPVPACVTLSHANTCLRMPYMSAGAPARTCACVRVWYSFHILSKAWFPRGNDRGHLIGEGWKQHLHPIGHTHDIKVLARQKHVKEIYITALTAPHTQGHRPLPLPIIKVTVHLLCLNSTFPITNKNITGRFFFFLCHWHYHPLHPFCVYQAANQN